MKRLLTGMLCLSLLALCACGQAVPEETSAAETTTAATTTATTTAAPSTTEACTLPPVEYPPSYKDAPTAYKPVLDELYALKQWLWSGEDNWDKLNWDEIWARRYTEDIMGAWNDGVGGYAVKDINNDGIPELMLFGGPNNLRSLFTLSNGQPVCLGIYGPRHWGGIAADGTVHYGGWGSAASGTKEIYRLEPHAAALTLMAGDRYDYWPPEEVDVYYIMVDGEQVTIDEEAYHAIQEKYDDPEKNPMKLNYIPIEQ